VRVASTHSTWSLHATQLSTTAEITLGALDRVPYTMSLVRRPEPPIVVSLSNAFMPQWQPRDERELELAGDVFGEIVSALYDGRKCVLVIEPEIDVLESEFSSDAGLRAKTIKSGKREGAAQHLYTWLAVDEDGLEWERPFWLCRKTGLKRLLRWAWTPHGPEGYVVRRGELSTWQACFSKVDPPTRLACWLECCQLMFESIGHGSGVQVVGRGVTVHEIRHALASDGVRRALRRLHRGAQRNNDE